MEPTRRRIPGTALSLWLQGPWPVVLVTLIGLAGLGVNHFHVQHRLGVGIALALSASVLLARRRSPLVALAAILAVAAASDYGPIISLASLLALVNVVLILDRATAAIAAAAAAVVMVATPAIHGHGPASLASVLSRIVAVGLAVAIGLYLRTRTDYIFGLRDRAERLERERELLAAQAVADERVRIARELHDVVAHNVSLMVVQAQALAATGSRPEQGETLDRIAQIGREALSEMHRMLGVLRIADGAGAERSPQPGIGDLEALIARARDAGLEASLTVEGAQRDLPSAVDLSAYRIVQEALTNVIRHADAKHVAVNLQYGGDQIELTVADDGRGPAPPGEGEPSLAVNGNGGGHGLIGMRVRVALFGGRLEAGPRLDRPGYLVHASLPLQ